MHTFEEQSYPIIPIGCDFGFIHEESSYNHSLFPSINLSHQPLGTETHLLFTLTNYSGNILDSYLIDSSYTKNQNRQILPQHQLLPQKQDINSQNQQNLQTDQNESSIRNQQKLNNYYLGHLDYQTSTSWPIFGQSRKFSRTKKGRHRKSHTQFEAIAKRMEVYKKKKQLDIESAKRYDQGLNEFFRMLPANQQEINDITPSALRNIIKNQDKTESKEVLDKFIRKYNSKRHWISFLTNFINQKPHHNNQSLFS